VSGAGVGFLGAGQGPDAVSHQTTPYSCPA
jgi:hypothetical protein